MRKYIASLCLVMLLPLTILAQGKEITGIVTDEDGATLPGVSILIKGTTKGTVSDIDGNYRLEGVSDNDVLTFTYIGFKVQEVQVGARSAISVAMKVDVSELEEVVVVGYATSSKRELTGSIGSVKGDVVKDVPVQSVQSLLQGRVSGVLVQADNGVPGAGLSLTVRSAGSISGGTTPLYVIDGVQLNTQDDSFNGASNPLAFLNPNDIESIEVLKDVSTVAKYGSKGANGVVLITTKKGKEGKSQINVSAYYGVNQAIKSPDFLNSQELIRFRMEQFERSARLSGSANPLGAGRLGGLKDTGFDLSPYGITDFTRPISQQMAEGIPQSDIDAFINGLPTVDWGEATKRDGIVQNYQVSASGGNSTGNYYISASFNDTKGPVIGTDYQRVTFRSNGELNASDRLTVGSNLSLSTSTQATDFVSGYFFGSPIFAEYGVLPWNQIRDTETGEFNEPLLGVNRDNPIKDSEFTDVDNRNNQLIGNAYAEYKFTDFLSYRGSVGMDYRDVNDTWYLDPRTLFGATREGQIQVLNFRNSNLITSHQLNFNTQLGEDHNLSGLTVFEYRNEKARFTTLDGRKFVNELFRTAAGAAEAADVSSGTTEYISVGLLANIKYSFKDKYFIDASVRRDGSSRFGTNNKWGTFPAVSVAWQIGDEGFLNSGLVEELKLRAGWGITGNDQLSNDRYSANFLSRTLYDAGSSYNGTPGISFSGLGNDQLGWEAKNEINLGLDFSLLGSRVNGSIDAYRNTPRDLLLNRELPGYAGAGSTVIQNLGELEAKGLEISLNTVNLNTGGFKWTTSFNIAFQESKVTRLYDGLQNISFDKQVGQPLFLWYQFDYAGVNPANGRPMWYDRNGDITYNPSVGSDVGADDDDRKPQGSIFSSSFGGFTNDFSYKGFTLSAFFSYDFGKTGSEGTHFFSFNPSEDAFNIERDLVDQVWKKPGDLARWAAPTDGDNFPNTAAARAGSAALQDLSYIRLKTVSLSYNLPQELLSRLGVSNLRVYAQGTNLWTLTNFTGIDPEFSGASNRARYPLSKTYTFGLELGF